MLSSHQVKDRGLQENVVGVIRATKKDVAECSKDNSQVTLVAGEQSWVSLVWCRQRRYMVGGVFSVVNC